MPKGVYVRSSQNICNLSLSHKGKSTWLKGLTKETDERVAKLGKNHSLVMKGTEHIGEWNQNISSSMMGKRKSDEHRQKLKNLWKDPVYKETRLKLLIGSSQNSPNKSEIKLGNILNSMFPDEYKYVGNGDTIMGGRIPDFINVNGQKKLIELYGDYWHRNQDENIRIDHFKQYGFDTLIIWEHELKNIDSLKMKLLKFNQNPFEKEEVCHQ
jgi:G:T-mismatch repair DNA endonuclease (very short patch repair protein)